VFNTIRQVGSVLGVAVPAAAYDLAAGGRFAGDAVFDGTRASLALAAVVVALGAFGVVRLLPDRAPSTLSTGEVRSSGPSDRESGAFVRTAVQKSTAARS
jgi:hypothetical protein